MTGWQQWFAEQRAGRETAGVQRELDRKSVV